MVDVERVKEALDRAHYDEAWPIVVNTRVALGEICDAARAYVRLAETGRQVEWCEVHKAPVSGRDATVCLQADWMDFGNWGDADEPCTLEPRFLSPLPDEE